MNTMNSLRTPFFSLIAVAASLAFVVFWAIHYPAQSSFALGVALITGLVATAVGMVGAMSLPPNSSFLTNSLGAGSWAAGLVMMFSAVLLAMPQIELSSARKNIDDVTPAVADQASEVLRQNPLDIHGAVSLLTPVLQSSTDPEDVDLFRQAHSAGVRGEAIDRVLANGFVHPDDKHALVQDLLAHAQDGDAQVIALLAMVSGYR